SFQRLRETGAVFFRRTSGSEAAEKYRPLFQEPPCGCRARAGRILPGPKKNLFPEGKRFFAL
ncbi:MAG: hypothetical protein LBK52_03825, partial [Deltaproteobacteria bacterium]|nr:hypothetical protein [Deltaproteobacteria bacterium]